MNRRREALGRNRRGPETTNLVPTFVVLAACLAGAGWFAYDYFTQPQRVFGARTLDCAATDVTWTQTGGDEFVISGCGKTVRASCAPRGACREVE